jgi:hypothetical protein
MRLVLTKILHVQMQLETNYRQPASRWKMLPTELIGVLIKWLE